MVKLTHSQYEECKKYIDNVIPQIIDVLEDKSISFTSDASMSEIKIKNKDKKEICSLIQTLPIPKSVLYFMIDLYEVKGNVYIRKKIKNKDN